MIEVCIEEVVAAANMAHASGKQWHFHILSPSCRFNQQHDCFALMVEIPKEKRILVAYTKDKPIEVGKKLVTLLHGSNVLESSGCTTAVGNNVALTMTTRMRRLNELKIPWHHHLLFPDCALNPHTGKWNLIFEDPVTGETLSATYDSEPISDLKEVESLFYAAPV